MYDTRVALRHTFRGWEVWRPTDLPDAEGADQIACTPRDRQQIGPTTWADAYNDCTAVAVQQTVDRTPRGAFNRPILMSAASGS